MSRLSVCLLMLLCTSVFVLPSHADNWPQWRGPNGDGVSSETGLPIVWSNESGVLWKRELPAWGDSTPAIWGDAVFVTSQLKAGQLVLLRIDKNSGQTKWIQQVGIGAPRIPTSGRKANDMRRFQEFHREQNMATPSPVTDGRVVVVHFGNGDLAAYDFDGDQLWHRNLQKDHGDYTIWWGHANSPVLCGKLVVSVCMQDSCVDLPGDPSPSYVVAHDALTGEQRWMTMRMTDATREHCDAYTTPILRRVDGREEIVVMGGQVLDAYEPTGGQRLWRLKGLEGNRLIPSPVAAHGLIFATQGMREALLAVKIDGGGERSRSDIVWEYEEGITDSPSPVVFGELIYFVSNNGIARCLDADSGTLLWTKRLPGQYRASPIAVDNRVYFLNTRGLTTVVAASPQFERLAENQLDDETIASPAISDGKIFIRGRKWLHCVN